jgi:hypothetical protein
LSSKTLALADIAHFVLDNSSYHAITEFNNR